MKEFTAMLSDLCESVINDMAITYVAESLRDLASISPNTFLQKKPGVSDLEVVNKKSLKSRIRYFQKIQFDI